MRTEKRAREAGFTLIELTVTLAILLIVMGAVFQQVSDVQKKSQREAMKLDLTQESREFVDQFTRDIHMSGYPVPILYASATTTITDQRVAAGFVFASPTEIRFEGDVYGDGNVYSVDYRYFANDPNDPNCPCLRRSAIPKINGNPVNGQNPPVYYTEVQNMIDPTGMAQGIFTFFDKNGNPVNVGAGADITTPGGLALIQQIDAIKVNLNTRTAKYDPQTGSQLVNSIAAIAELEN